MSIFMTSLPTHAAPPSYSRTRIQPPPYKAAESGPTPSSQPIKVATSFSPFRTITRVFTNSTASTSSSSIALSTADSTTSSASVSPSVPVQPPVSPEDRGHPSPRIPPPTYSPIKSAPKPLTSPPAYAVSAEPRPATGVHPRSDTFITRGEVIPGRTPILNYEAEEWDSMREREERRRFDELQAAKNEEAGCCAWWWASGPSQLPWNAYYVF